MCPENFAFLIPGILELSSRLIKNVWEMLVYTRYYLAEETKLVKKQPIFKVNYKLYAETARTYREIFKSTGTPPKKPSKIKLHVKLPAKSNAFEKYGYGHLGGYTSSQFFKRGP